jgi:hypothetical protein
MLRVTSLVEAVVPVDLVTPPDADEGAEGNSEAATLSGPTARPVWSLNGLAVWACAVAMPRNMVAMMKERCIAPSCVEFNRKAAPSPSHRDNVRSAKTENEH